jgi:hypothetical protein
LPIQRLINDPTQKPSDFLGFDDPVPQSIKPTNDTVQLPDPRFSNNIFFDFNNNSNQLLIKTLDLFLPVLFSNDVDRVEVYHDASDFFIVEDDILSKQSISIALKDFPLVP